MSQRGGLVQCFLYAGVAELADALDLGSSAARRGGSSPLVRTNTKQDLRWIFLSYCNFYLSGSPFFLGKANNNKERPRHEAALFYFLNPIFFSHAGTSFLAALTLASKVRGKLPRPRP